MLRGIYRLQSVIKEFTLVIKDKSRSNEVKVSRCRKDFKFKFNETFIDKVRAPCKRLKDGERRETGLCQRGSIEVLSEYEERVQKSICGEGFSICGEGTNGICFNVMDGTSVNTNRRKKKKEVMNSVTFYRV